MDIWWFSRVITHHPYAILIAVFVFSSTCLIVPFATKKFPDFTDPQLGFEARGTTLAQRLTAWVNLIEATHPRGELVENPLEYYYYLQYHNQPNKTHPQNRPANSTRRRKGKNKNKQKGKNNVKPKYEASDNGISKSEDKWKELRKLGSKNHLDSTEEHDRHLNNNEFFCNLPSSAYSRVVLSSERDDKSLWSMEGILAQCHIDDALRSNPEFQSLCQTQAENGPGSLKCCRSWSPANFVALLSNRSSCLGVTEIDLIRVEILLQRCAYYYHNLQLTPDCADNLDCQKRVPVDCYAYNAPYHLLHYLLDIDFVQFKNQDSASKLNTTLNSVMLFLPIAASSATLDFYNNLNFDGLFYGNFRVVAIDLGLKSTLFDRLLVSDSSLLLSGFAFITVCIWIYSTSIFLTITTILAVLFSLGISYAIYTLVLRINFFPFMNLLAVVVAVGIGADDAFIYCKIWECNKQQKLTNGGMERLVQETMAHALPSMFTTCLTTAVAFFASIVSNVTAINCFSLFSGMTVVANFFLMVTWLPACVVIAEKWHLSFLTPAHFIVRKIIRPLKLFMNRISNRYSHCLAQFSVGLRWFWFMVLGAVAIAGISIIFHYPGLQLPDSPNFQLFDSSHPFEQYELIYAKRFWFEKLEMGDGGAVLPLRFIWGVKPIDNGNYNDPSARGSFVHDESFDMTDAKSQEWLQQFCRNLRNQPFYRSTLGPLLPNCFIDTLRNWMERRCEDPADPSTDKMPCCKQSTFPYKPEVLRECAAKASDELYKTPSHLWTRGAPITAGLKFLREEIDVSNITFSSKKLPFIPKIRALVVEYDSTFVYSLSFAEMNRFYNQVEKWMQEQLTNAPPGMKGGWFVSRLEFYELQRTLYEGTIWAMIVSMILALIVLAFVTLNFLVSLYAIIAIGAAIVVIVAALVLLGWRLNVLESVAVSTAIGLATDFSLHYGVSYRACSLEKNLDRATVALKQMGGPTLMAAITSGAAGALMLPSQVLAYIQIGLFLILVMGVSWIYATFFLCPILAIVGPSPTFAQFQYLRLWRALFNISKKRTNTTKVEKEVSSNRRRWRGRGMFSESTISTSSTVCQIHCSELENLAVRPPSPSFPPSPTATLLHLESSQTNLKNNRRKQSNDHE